MDRILQEEYALSMTASMKATIAMEHSMEFVWTLRWEDIYKYFLNGRPIYTTTPIVHTNHFLFILIYLKALSFDTEFLSSLIITQKALEEQNRIKESLKEIETLKKEHYRKFGTWWEKLKNN